MRTSNLKGMRYAEANLQAIHIIVKDGRLTLEGVVVSQADQDAANR
jgi:hypothetical protein